MCNAKFFVSALALILSCAVVQTRADSILFYGGDLDTRGGFANGINTSSLNARTFDDFSLSSGKSITRLFSNNQMSFTTNQAYYEIRSGVANGVGGTLLKSGNVAVSQTPTGRTFGGLSEYHLETTALTPFVLGAGTYWLTLAPIGPGFGTSYLSSTQGANGIGSPLDNGKSFLDRPPTYVFRDTGLVEAGPWDFSLGVYGNPQNGNGTPVPAVPTPGAYAGGIVLLGLLGGMKMIGKSRRTRA